jgi:glucose/arabinose dehydrogenase
MSPFPRRGVLAGCALVLLTGSAVAQVLKGPAAFGDWQSDKPGVRRLITAQDLPGVTQASSGEAKVVNRPADAVPRVPDGFTVESFATGFKQPRAMRVAPNGDLFVADSKANEIHVYRAGNGGKVSAHAVFAKGLHQPYGIAFYPPGADPKWVYIGNSDSVVRFPYKAGEMKAAGKAETIVAHIPSVHHWTRDLAFTPDGTRLLIAVGSGSNIAEGMPSEPHATLLLNPHPVKSLADWIATEPLGAAWDTEEVRADVLSVDPQGRDMKIFATGLRNCAGLTINPTSGEPWCVVNERDLLGDNTPFEYATHVTQGAFYGWPWYYIGGNEDPRLKGARPDLKDKVTIPDVLMQAHSAPLQIAFYDGSSFPSEYRGGAFVTLHGSWNRANRTGYKVVYLPFKDAKATGEYVDFMTGFVTPDGAVWGRPVGVAVAKDGSLYVSDDGSKTVWRVTRK